MSMPGVPAGSVTPHSFACCTTFSACACSSRALVGMQPQMRQVPPSAFCRSTTATFFPSCDARMAATYPPVPAPITTTSYACAMSNPLVYSATSMAPRRKTLLIVDDDEGMRDTFNVVLRHDYRILRAATGESALQIMQKEDIDLMILDVRLPGINGFEVLKIVKENYPYVEVIVASVLNE